MRKLPLFLFATFVGAEPFLEVAETPEPPWGGAAFRGHEAFAKHDNANKLSNHFFLDI